MSVGVAHRRSSTFAPFGGWLASTTRWAATHLRWQRDLSRDSMLLLGILVGIAQAMGWFAAPVDGLAYWEAGTSTRLYPEFWSESRTGYLFYPPPVAQVSALLQPMGWPAFIVCLTILTFMAFWYCAGRWSLLLVSIGVPWLFGIGPEEPAKFLAYALIGNLQWILAALTVLAIRHPSLWAVELVTKVTTGIGWWWHVLRGEWRAAATGAVATVIIVGISAALSPSLWSDYLGFALRNHSASDPPLLMFPIPLGLRLASAATLLIWGARTDRAWTVPVACGWSLVGMWGFAFLPFFVAAWRVRQDAAVERHATPLSPTALASGRWRPSPRRPLGLIGEPANGPR
jgi:hypothetical protein